MIFTRSRAYFNRTRVPSTKHIILRVCGWYLYFRLVFPGSDRIITLGIKDFKKMYFAQKKLCLHLHGTDWSRSQFVYFHVKVCFDLYPSKRRREKTQWKVHKLSEDLQVCSFCENVRKDFCIERKTL